MRISLRLPPNRACTFQYTRLSICERFRLETVARHAGHKTMAFAASRIVSIRSVTRFADRARGGDDASRMAQMCRRTPRIGGRAGGQSGHSGFEPTTLLL